MKPTFRPNRRMRLRVTLLAVVSLLLQQVAFAAYACAAVRAPMASATMTMCAHCPDKASTQHERAPPLCAQHCARQTLATQDARLPNVPPALMAAMVPAASVLVPLPAAQSTYSILAARRTSGIPPALRFRVLLI